MTDTIDDVAAEAAGQEPVEPAFDEQSVAEQLVAQAREKDIELVGPDGLLSQLTKRVLETALEAEMTDHLGYAKHDPMGRNRGNSRNGVWSKTVLTEIGPVEIEVPRDVEATFTPARDAVSFIRALGLGQVDLFGFAMGGMIAQVIAQQQPQLVRKMIIAGTGPAGGEGIDKVTRITYLDTARGLLTRQDPKQFLFFTRTSNGRRAGKKFLARLAERTNDRDKAISVRSFRAQLKAIHRWGRQKSADLGSIHQPVLVINGDSDKMVPTKNTIDLHRRLPNSQLVIYPDAGHGGVFQFHKDFIKQALEFL